MSKNKKINKYKRMKRTLVMGASSGIVAGMILMGSARTVLAETAENFIPAYSQNTTVKGMHLLRRSNSPARINTLAGSFGLNSDEVKKELKSGKTMKQVLQENGVDTTLLHKVFKNSGRKHHNKNS